MKKYQVRGLLIIRFSVDVMADDPRTANDLVDNMSANELESHKNSKSERSTTVAYFDTTGDD